MLFARNGLVVEGHAGEGLGLGAVAGARLDAGVHPLFDVVPFQTAVGTRLELVQVVQARQLVRAVLAVLGTVADPRVGQAFARLAPELVHFAAGPGSGTAVQRCVSTFTQVPASLSNGNSSWFSANLCGWNCGTPFLTGFDCIPIKCVERDLILNYENDNVFIKVHF